MDMLNVLWTYIEAFDSEQQGGNNGVFPPSMFAAQGVRCVYNTVVSGIPEV